MTLYEQIKTTYPTLEDKVFMDGTIILQNDSDGYGDYIREWNYTEPLPNGLTVGKGEVNGN